MCKYTLCVIFVCTVLCLTTVAGTELPCISVYRKDLGKVMFTSVRTAAPPSLSPPNTEPRDRLLSAYLKG